MTDDRLTPPSPPASSASEERFTARCCGRSSRSRARSSRARASSIFLLDEEADELVFEAVAGEGRSSCSSGSASRRAPGIAGWVLVDAARRSCSRTSARDPRFARDVAESDRLRAEGDHGRAAPRRRAGARRARRCSTGRRRRLLARGDGAARALRRTRPRSRSTCSSAPARPQAALERRRATRRRSRGSRRRSRRARTRPAHGCSRRSRSCCARAANERAPLRGPLAALEARSSTGPPCRRWASTSSLSSSSPPVVRRSCRRACDAPRRLPARPEPLPQDPCALPPTRWFLPWVDSACRGLAVLDGRTGGYLPTFSSTHASPDCDARRG